MKTIRSYCRNCTANCGTVFEVEDNKVVSHKRDTAHLVSEGFVCIKGEMAVELLTQTEARLTECLERDGDGFVPIAADKAVDDIAHRLGEIIARHGPRALGMFYGTSAYTKSLTLPFGRALLAALGTPNLFSTMTIDSSAHWVADGRMGKFRTGRPHIDDADCIMVSGSNPMVSHFAFNSSIPMNHQSRHVRDLRKRGTFIVIDPRKTETARMADIHLQPRPGYDAEIYACLLRMLLDRGWHDVAFTERYLANVDRLRVQLEPFTVERVAELAGVDGATLEAIAQTLHQAKRPTVSLGTGVSMSPNANLATHLGAALNAICGGFARAGDAIRHPGFFYRRATEEGVIPPDRTWERAPHLRSGHGQLYGEFGASRLIDEMSEQGEGQIRALIVLGANPAMAFGEPDRMKAALEGLDLLIVIDPRMTETAELADYVIATSVQYETTDFTRNNDVKFIKPFVQFTEGVLAPPPGVVNEWEFLNDLANRMGHTLTLPNTHPGAPGLALDPAREWTDEDIIRWHFDQAGLSFDEVRASPGGLSPECEPRTIVAPTEDNGARMDVCPADVEAELAALSGRVPESPRPYRLTVRRIVETMNSAYRFSTITRRRNPTNPLYMNPEDMARDGLSTGALVEISGEHGSIRAYVAADATMRPGVVSITHCWGTLDGDADPLAQRGAHSSRLVSMRLEDVQPIDAMPMHSALPVTIALLSAAAVA